VPAGWRRLAHGCCSREQRRARCSKAHGQCDGLARPTLITV
jgi:hypothetical protein